MDGSRLSIQQSQSASVLPCNPCQRPAVAGGRQDESPINHPTKDNKSYGIEFNQTKQESEARSLQDVREDKGRSGTVAGVPAPSAHVPVPRAAWQNPCSANQRENEYKGRPLCCDSPWRFLERG